MIINLGNSVLDAACYAHHVFKAFDVNSTGAISFRVKKNAFFHTQLSKEFNTSLKLKLYNPDMMLISWRKVCIFQTLVIRLKFNF